MKNSKLIHQELSKASIGVNYNQLDEYQQDSIDESVQGLKELLKFLK